MSRSVQYPYHLARLVGTQLRAACGSSPPETVLVRLLETLYFASLKTEEGQPILCTLNYMDPAQAVELPGMAADRWQPVAFAEPLPLDVRTLTKLAKAVDPTVSSLAVYADRSNRLFIWGLVDQEVRYSDYISLDSAARPQRPGAFQATINGVGNISAQVNYTLLGSLEQNTLIEQYHDVLWSGPIHQILQNHLRDYLAHHNLAAVQAGVDARRLENEMLVRWVNALCRVLMNVQQYRHGAGLLIAPRDTPDALDIKYRITYDRLAKALLGLVLNEFYRGTLSAEIARHCDEERSVPASLHKELRATRRKFDELKSAVLGCAHFIASLSSVDGFVLFDRHLTVNGFGAEVRSDNRLTEIFVAGDSPASNHLLRRASLSHFGTRHRAMMRYCFDHPTALGFVVSQDCDVRAITRLGDKLVLWENIEVQLAFKVENRFLLGNEPVLPECQPNPKVA